MQPLFHIQSSGTILDGFENKTFSYTNPLGVLSEFLTDDGSFSLHSSYFKETFHSRFGAIKEAQQKFVTPSQIDRFRVNQQINVLDVCVGLGYNSACLMELILGTSLSLNWIGLELDKRPLQIALKTDTFLGNWSEDVLAVLQELSTKGEWKQKRSKGKIFWGDARQKLRLLPIDKTFDLILLDAFSPSNCPELWSEEFLKALSGKLAPDGRLLTYCSAAAIRSTLKKSGLILRSLRPNLKEKQTWSSGTMAIKPNHGTKEMITNSPYWRLLSPMEEEHLLTRAAIPYRDHSGFDTKTVILDRRKREQHQSDLEETNTWHRRWGKVESN